MAGVTAEPSDFWNDLQDLGLVGDAPGVPQFRGPRSSAPGCFTSMPATPPGQRSASPGGPRPSSLIAAASQGMHNSSPSSPAAPAGRLQHGVMSGSGRQSASMPGNVPLPASHEQAYKELYESLEQAEAAGVTTGATATATAAQPSRSSRSSVPEIRESASLEPCSSSKRMNRNSSMQRKPLVLSLNTLTHDQLLAQQQRVATAARFSSFRSHSPSKEYELSSTGRLLAALPPMGASILSSSVVPSAPLTHRLSNVGSPAIPQPLPSIPKAPSSTTLQAAPGSAGLAPGPGPAVTAAAAAAPAAAAPTAFHQAGAEKVPRRSAASGGGERADLDTESVDQMLQWVSTGTPAHAASGAKPAAGAARPSPAAAAALPRTPPAPITAVAVPAPAKAPAAVVAAAPAPRASPPAAPAVVHAPPPAAAPVRSATAAGPAPRLRFSLPGDNDAEGAAAASAAAAAAAVVEEREREVQAGRGLEPQLSVRKAAPRSPSIARPAKHTGVFI